MADERAGETLGFHSVEEERHEELPVEGEIPGWLSGTLVRNGPGSFRLGGARVTHWFDGLAMLRRFSFDDGRVDYRNRFLRTEAYRDAKRGEYAGGFGTDPSQSLLERLFSVVSPPSPTDNTNVDVRRLGGEYVAHTETENLTLFDPETLETTGLTSYLGEPAGQHVVGHPVYDPTRGETVGVSTHYGRRCEYRVWRQSDGRWARETLSRIPVEEPAYLHSFGLTDRYVLIVEFPFVVTPSRLLLPSNEAFVKRFDWRPERGTRFLVIDRETGETVAEPTAEAFFCFHHVNAYEDGDEVIVDMVTFADPEPITELYFEEPTVGVDFEMEGGRLDRYRLSLGGSPDVSAERLHDGHIGLPRISPDVLGSPYRYAYGQGQRGQPLRGIPGEVLKVDTRTGRARAFAPESTYTSEPVFVPRPGGEREDDGVVLSVGLNTAEGRSYLHVLDGESMTEVGRAALPHALPLDFHGRFFPSDRRGFNSYPDN
jgi:beta-carotene 15,15'-monooxygenase